MNRLFLWSNVTGQFAKASQAGGAKSQADEAAKGGDKVQTQEVKSVDELIALFANLCQQPDQWNTVTFHTHGSAGSIGLGSTTLNLTNYTRLGNQNLSRMFAKDCLITFEGCNVAEGGSGEYFLIEIASTLLRSQGGKVRGNTSGGIGINFGGDNPHPFGRWVTANLSPGGGLRLENGTALNVVNLQTRLAELKSAVAKLKNAHFYWKNEAEKCITSAENWLEGGASWYARYVADDSITKGNGILKSLSDAQLGD